MASSELTLEEIYQYFVQNGGVVTNTEIIGHFRRYLMDPQTKVAAKANFKQFVNQLASTRSSGNQKILTLRPRYQNAPPTPTPTQPKYQIGIPTSPHTIGIPISPTPSTTSTGIPSPASSVSAYISPQRAPPPYRPPPPVQSPSNITADNTSTTSSTFSLNLINEGTPQAPPRRRSSSDKLLAERRDSLENSSSTRTTTPTSSSCTPKDSKISEKENEQPADDQQLSVKERTQKFNRLASVEDDSVSPKPPKPKKKVNNKGVDEDDGASVTSLEPKKCAEWYVAAAKGDYHELAKLAGREPRFVKLKDPYTAYTVLHWGAKHGNADIIKLFAGHHGADVNAKTNGGYTPLHLAAHFGRTTVYNLLIQVYKADQNIRDYRGKKPAQYVQKGNQERSKATIKIKSRKNKYGDKFLRVGSLNVRVKKTTEAFSSFLGVGSSGSMSSIEPIEEKMHKGWGSADNVTQEGSMPAPKGYMKRKSKRPIESRTHSNPGTPNQPQRFIQRNSLQDSDSDSAAGFDSTWQN